MNTVEKRVRTISKQLDVDLYELDAAVEKVEALITAECAAYAGCVPYLRRTKKMHEWMVRDICLNLVYESPYDMTWHDAIRVIVCLRRGRVGWYDFKRHDVWVTAQDVRYCILPRLVRKVVRLSIGYAVYIDSHQTLPQMEDVSSIAPILIGACIVRTKRPDLLSVINGLIAQLPVPHANGLLYWAITDALDRLKSEGKIDDVTTKLILRVLAQG